MRYASRVSWWMLAKYRTGNPFRGKVTLVVQNRSPVPIYWPTLRITLSDRPADPGPVDIMLPHLPPCTVLYVPLQPGYDWDQQVEAFYFSDGRHTWKDSNGVHINQGGLTPITNLASAEIYGQILGADQGRYPAKWTSAMDCGQD